MNTPTRIQTFTFDSTRVCVDRSGAAFVSNIDDRRGHTLSAYPVARNEDLHPEHWEEHPQGDEVLLMCSGALDVVTRFENVDTSTRLDAGHGLIVPRGVWHRLALRKPGLLIALTPRAGTRMCSAPL